MLPDEFFLECASEGEIIDPDYYSRDFLKTAVDEISLT